MNYIKEPYEIIEKKLEIAELTISLIEVRKEKWEKLGTMKHILNREEELLKEIEDKTASLKDLQQLNGKK